MKDELLDFWDSIPIRWGAFKKDKTKLFNLIIVAISVPLSTFMVATSDSDNQIGLIVYFIWIMALSGIVIWKLLK